MRTVLVNCRVTSGTIERTGSVSVLNRRITLHNAWPYPFAGNEPEQLPSPVISYPEGDITSRTLFSLSCANEAAAIYYTIDGSLPTLESTLYTQPFALFQKGDITIKAVAMLEGYTNSEVAEATFSVANFNLTTPQPVISELGPASFQISWPAVDEATSYELGLAYDPLFNNLVPGFENQVLYEPSLFVQGLTHNTSYYCRVKALGIAAESGSSEISATTLYAFSLTKVGTGADQQTIRLGNTQDFTITVQNGTIAAVSNGTIAPGGKSAVITGISDSGSSDYRTITFAAMGALNEDIVTLSSSGTLHYLYIVTTTNGANIVISGALPENLTTLYLSGAEINWTYNGALPENLTYIYLLGTAINWTYNGALPANLTTLVLNGAAIAWSYNGALPAKLITLYLNGAAINWTYNVLPGIGNIAALTLNNYRIGKMSSADMVIMLSSLSSRSGSLPATITINDYADYANPPQSVIDAVAALKAAKPNVTTVNLGA